MKIWIAMEKLKSGCISPKEKDQLEKAVQKIPKASIYYAQDVIKGRWLPGEKTILSSSMASIQLRYVWRVVKGRWPELEPVLLERVINKKHGYRVRDLVQYAIISGYRWPEAEEIIKSDGRYCYRYAVEAIKGRWPEAEEVIMSSLGRHNEASTEVEDRDAYLFRFIQSPSEEFEKRIRASKKDFAKKTHALLLYAETCLKGRLPDDLHNMMVLVGDNFAREYIGFLKSLESSAA